jgi:hypothetical protein
LKSPGKKVLLDSDVAELYGAQTKEINQAVIVGYQRVLNLIFEVEN